MTDLAFTSRLPAEHADALERLLFFNANQARAIAGITAAVARYGRPKIRIVHDHVRVDVASPVQTQALFVVEPLGPRVRPVGVMVFTREDDTFVAPYVAVHEDFGRAGPRAGAKLGLRMLAELEAIARRVRGVEFVALYLDRAEPVRRRVRRSPTRPGGMLGSP